MKLALTRADVKAILSGELKAVETRADAIFGLRIPISCPDVDPEVLDPRATWKDAAAYDRKAHELATVFQLNFEENASVAPPEIKAAGPPTQ